MAEPRRCPEGVTCWIDVEQPDLEAAQAFYAGLLGWAFQDATPGEDGARYLVASLDGHPVAGVTSGAPAWNTYVAVDDADEVARRIGAAYRSGSGSPARSRAPRRSTRPAPGTSVISTQESPRCRRPSMPTCSGGSSTTSAWGR